MDRRVCIQTFYRFVPLTDLAGLQQRLLDWGRAHGMRGSILLAAEGINGTVSALEETMDRFFEIVAKTPALADLETKTSWSETQPFQRFKVRLKQEIVHFGVEGLDPTDSGIYVEPNDWNRLIEDPEVVVVDTRNDYEMGSGQFRGAIQPDTHNFRDFPEWSQKHLDPDRHPKVAMYCTGGIRCEKATAYLKTQGFTQVFHLKGGILRYLEEIEPADSTWEGECFVFDERVTVDHKLAPGSFSLCPSCQNPRPSEELTNDCPQCRNRVD